MEGDNVHYYEFSNKSISIHSLRVEGDHVIYIIRHQNNCISIHSLRVEGDRVGVLLCLVDAISIHSLRVEGDIYILFY